MELSQIVGGIRKILSFADKQLEKVSPASAAPKQIHTMQLLKNLKPGEYGHILTFNLLILHEADSRQVFRIYENTILYPEIAGTLVAKVTMLEDLRVRVECAKLGIDNELEVTPI